MPDPKRVLWYLRKVPLLADLGPDAIARMAERVELKEARRRDVQWIRYWSARDVAGHCGAVFDPDSLKAVGLNKQQTWVRKVSAGAALMRHERDSISLAFTFS